MRRRGRDKKKQAGAQDSPAMLREMVVDIVEMRVQLAVLQCNINIGGVVCAVAVFLMLQL
ncbi:MAG: hypothetical protein OD918_00760 [Gammaproteobacteria bacterium]